jgi:hypothetical protein
LISQSRGLGDVYKRQTELFPHESTILAHFSAATQMRQKKLSASQLGL